MSCAGTSYTAGKDLSSLGHITAKTRNILVIDMLYLINAESANLLAALSATVVRSVSHFEVLLSMRINKCS
jgi:hypothetical protein